MKISTCLVVLFYTVFQCSAQSSGDHQSKPATVPTSPQFEVVLDTGTQSNFGYVIDAGDIPIDLPVQSLNGGDARFSCDSPTPASNDNVRTIDIKIRYTGDKATTLALFKKGNFLRAAVWADGAETESFRKGDEKHLLFSFGGVRDKKIPQDLIEVVAFTPNLEPVLAFSVDYLGLPRFIDREISQENFLSGHGKNKSEYVTGEGYRLETGPAPSGYEVFQACPALVGERTCGHWASCDLYSRTAGNVGANYVLQGQEDNFSHELVSKGVLRVRYELKPTEARIVVNGGTGNKH